MFACLFVFIPTIIRWLGILHLIVDFINFIHTELVKAHNFNWLPVCLYLSQCSSDDREKGFHLNSSSNIFFYYFKPPHRVLWLTPTGVAWPEWWKHVFSFGRWLNQIVSGYSILFIPTLGGKDFQAQMNKFSEPPMLSYCAHWLISSKRWWEHTISLDCPVCIYPNDWKEGTILLWTQMICG